MQPPTKDQTSIGFDEPTIDASDSPDNKDMARQEFAKEADINYMLSRFGVVPERGAPQYGEWDDTMDLQQAITSVQEARLAYNNLPEELRKKFNSMDDILTAYQNGSLVIVDGEVPVPPKTEAELLEDRIKELEARLPAPAPA